MSQRTGYLNRPATGRDVRDVDHGQDAQSACYLLFAGSGVAPRGGMADLVKSYTSEETAFEAFHELRIQRVSNGWAQLAIVDVQKGVKPLCWFGTTGAARPGHVVGRGGAGSPPPVLRSALRRILSARRQ